MARSISITTESGGRQNIFPTEVRTQLVEDYTSYPVEAISKVKNLLRGLIAFD